MNSEAILRGFHKRAIDFGNWFKKKPSVANIQPSNEPKLDFLPSINTKYDDVAQNLGKQFEPAKSELSPIVKTPAKFKSLADNVTGMSVGKIMRPAQVIAPFYGNKLIDNVNAAEAYNKANPVLPYSIKQRLSQPVPVNFNGLEDILQSRALQTVTRTEEPAVQMGLGLDFRKKPLPLFGSWGGSDKIQPTLNMTPNEQDVQSHRGFGSTLVHELGHMVYPEPTRYLNEPETKALKGIKTEDDFSTFKESIRDIVVEKAKKLQELKATNPDYFKVYPSTQSDHDLNKAEVINYLGEMQRNQFLNTGERFTSPEQFTDWLDTTTTKDVLPTPPLKPKLPNEFSLDDKIKEQVTKAIEENTLSQLFQRAHDLKYPPSPNKLKLDYDQQEQLLNSYSKEIEPRIQNYPIELKRFIRRINDLKHTDPDEYKRYREWMSKMIPGLVQNNVIPNQG